MEDWTKNIQMTADDYRKFTDMMLRVQNGEDVERECPFCGGRVAALESEEKKTVIGCDSCDMRIILER